MIRRYCGVVLIAGVVSALACSSSDDGQNLADRPPLADAIESAFARNRLKLLVDDRKFGPFLRDVEFRSLYRQSLEYEADARTTIGDSSTNLDTKVVAVLLMQCLPLDRYVAFVRFIFDKTKAGSADPILLATAVFPGEQWGDGLAMAYDVPQVRLLLETIRDWRTGDSEVGDSIAWILDGRTAKYLRDHRAAGAPMPVIDCEASN
jgi:hypothetical protein